MLDDIPQIADPMERLDVRYLFTADLLNAENDLELQQFWAHDLDRAYKMAADWCEGTQYRLDTVDPEWTMVQDKRPMTPAEWAAVRALIDDMRSAAAVDMLDRAMRAVVGPLTGSTAA